MNMIIPAEKILSDSKILIVDDARISRMILVEVCKNAGFVNIEEARDGAEALEKIKGWSPDLVFVDMNMPNMDGLQLCHELKRRKLIKDMVIIMQTTSDKPELKVQAFKVGITDFITKPIESIEVSSRAVAHLERLLLHRQVEFNYLRIHEELKEAALLQNILLPSKSLLENIKTETGIDIAYHFQPAMELAGDYLSVRKLSGNKVALISVDVSGHGVTAALYAFSIHTLLDNNILGSNEPGEVLEILNSQLHNLMPTGRFASIFLGVIDIENGRLDYASAAAPSPILLSKEKITILETKGHLWGTCDDANYKTNTVSLEKGDMLFLYSDALLETANAEGVFMKEQDVLDILSANLSKNSKTVLKSVLNIFDNEYSKHITDDLSLLVYKV